MTSQSPTTELLGLFAPERFGFRRDGQGWSKTFPDGTTAAFLALGWQHVQSPSYDLVAGQRLPTDALGLVLALQARTWGMPPELLVPTNVLAIIPDTGGAVLIAYDVAQGFNADGWLGFIIGLGARSGILVSHMLGVREDRRGRQDLGFLMKVVQAHEALASGHHAMIWTFDPMRGANARLNLEKLGATVEEFTFDKYGALTSELYGDVPSDRFTARWELDARSAERLLAVCEGRYRGLTLDDVADLPEARSDDIGALVDARTPRLRYRIPGDVDELMRSAPELAVRWRQEAREVLSCLLTTKSAAIPDPSDASPMGTDVQKRRGAYVINGFASGRDETGERISYYVLERRAT
jgi:chorismate synthase